jgi:excisionase family DNA binding protein
LSRMLWLHKPHALFLEPVDVRDSKEFTRKKNQRHMEQQFLNVEEAAKFLRISKSKIQKMTAPNVKKTSTPIPFYKIGKKIVFDRKELIDYVKGARVIQMQLPINEFELLKIPSLAA